MIDNFSIYGASFQSKLIANLFTNSTFLQQAQDILDLSYFDSEGSKWIVRWVKEYYEKYKTTPTMSAAGIEVEQIAIPVLRESVKNTLLEVYKQFEAKDSAWVQDKALDFCKNQKLKNAIIESIDLVKAGNYDEVRTVIDSALKAGLSFDLGANLIDTVERRYEQTVRSAIATGWSSLDSIIGGGLSFGELGVVVAPPGVGKSWCLANIGANAVKLGKTVLHFTLELNEDYVNRRYDSILTGIDQIKCEFHLDEIKERLSKLGGTLIVKEFYTGQLSINGLIAHIQRFKTTTGKNPDLIIIDYGDLMKLGNKSNKYDNLEDLYIALRGVAGELRVPIWTASQSGRDSVDSDIVEGDSIAGSFAKLMVADLVISLSRRLKDKLAQTGRFHIIKNRFGPDGVTFPSKLNLSNGRIFMYDSNSQDGKETSIEMERGMETYKEKLRAIKSVLDLKRN